ncbi:Holliday junction DNA helicase subunit RuvA [Peptoniphilus asaccharolyticus DSM 20463]|uniref:Holliday junction branch migration complex subunit RuvA n=1 Tax=Peptoniphilus asaccharolyticus DSM 20463 TaxID=573058 RepID=A0A1W1USW4_PEPAS|nr:Holliday junction branch migration protein RuvA [Peptoniphilus asaccharolyticus]MBL7575138.1 Holliday junction branch migration protein RuvA [Peptoniphilus asaccharolyticus]SMB84130.1 Holliday junction DNA helicase subunit RuvA [Peptoniphilus asaccharolyticus DSM 20463]
MFDFIKGEVVEINENYCVVENNSKGYVIYMPKIELEDLSYNQQKIFVRLIVREDSLTLYGFLTRESRILFDLLTSVSSVGPKVGLGLLSAIPLGNIVYAISSEDSNVLTGAPGVGKKTAQRIVLELKDKIPKYNFNLAIEDVVEVIENDGAIDALISLGYNTNEAKLALNGVDKSLDIGEQIKYALKNLGK